MSEQQFVLDVEIDLPYGDPKFDDAELAILEAMALDLLREVLQWEGC